MVAAVAVDGGGDKAHLFTSVFSTPWHLKLVGGGEVPRTVENSS